MDGFNKMVKMKCGGSVSKAVEEAKKCGGGRMKEGGKVHEDLAEDKALIKKELGKFAAKEDKAEKPELKLKSGGRIKKSVGSVNKFKAADAPSKAAVKPNFKGSDVEKEKSKPAGEKDAIKKVKPTGDKKAAAPSKAAVKPKEVKKFAAGGALGGSVSSVPPAIAAQLMQSAQDAQLQGPHPTAMGSNPVPGNNPVISGNPVIGNPAPGVAAPGAGGGMGAGGGGRGGMNPAMLMQLLRARGGMGGGGMGGMGGGAGMGGGIR